MVIARAASQAMRWSSRVVSIEVLIESWCGDALLLTGVGLVYLRSEVDAVNARTRALDAHEDAIGQTGRELARTRPRLISTTLPPSGPCTSMRRDVSSGSSISGWPLAAMRTRVAVPASPQ